MTDINDPDAIGEVRAFLERRMGIDPATLTDDGVRETARALLKNLGQTIPAGSPPINGRAWLGAALTIGGFKQPEDRKQRAELNDGGSDVDLAVLAVLVMRYLARSRPKTMWTDEALAAQLHQPVEDLRRSQVLLDEVAGDVGVPSTLGPRWWEQPA
jgi:hypothetical protein